MSSILIINPNSDGAVTEKLKEVIDPAPDFTYQFFTAPSGPQSIQSATEEVTSAAICLQALLPVLDQYDGFLVACYSDHPLVESLREHTQKPVLGIFHASVLYALAYNKGKFGIVTTSVHWEQALGDAVLALLGTHLRYAGTFSTKLTIKELVSLTDEELHDRMIDAAKDAVQKGAETLILGCAGMAGMEEIVRKLAGKPVRVIDGVIAGAEMLVGLVRSSNNN